MTLDDKIKEVAAAGFYWAIEGGGDGYCMAVVQPNSSYVGDGLSGPGAKSGSSPLDALTRALAGALAAQHRGAGDE